MIIEKLQNTEAQVEKLNGVMAEYCGEDVYIPQKDTLLAGVYLAGGAITSIFTDSKVNDLDFYCVDPYTIPRIDAFLTIAGFELAFTTDVAKSYINPKNNKKAQVITRFVGGAKKDSGKF